MYSARDGQRTLEFEGRLLAESSSRKQGGTRWVEFKLYKTNGGSYVLSRIGQSLVFHHPSCKLVKQYNLKPGEPNDDAVPCYDCNPDWEEPIVFPEKIRYWAQAMSKPHAVLEAVVKIDENGASYLTNVAQRLLEEAAAIDDGIASVYATEYVP